MTDRYKTQNSSCIGIAVPPGNGGYLLESTTEKLEGSGKEVFSAVIQN